MLSAGLAELVGVPVVMEKLGPKAPPPYVVRIYEKRAQSEVVAQPPPVPETPIDISGIPELRDGVLKVGSDIAYAPFEFFKEGTQVPDGLDVDLTNALAQRLGVQATFHNTRFDGIIRALKSKRFDIIMSAMTITDERTREIEFVPYYATPTMGTAVLVPKGNPRRIRRLTDLCGLRVAVQEGTVQVEEVKSIVCTQKMKINLSTFHKNPEAVQQLKLGRVDALLADLSVAAFDAKQANGELELVPNRFKYAPYGIGLRKDSTQLKTALTQALQAIRGDGTYDSILKKWGA